MSVLDAYAPMYPGTLAFAGTSSAAVPFYAASERFKVVLCPSADCFIRIGSSAVAAANSSAWLLKAGKVYQWNAFAGESDYFRVIQSSGAGTLYWYIPGGDAGNPNTIFGSKLVEWWSVESSATGGGSGSWVGLKQRLSIPAVGAPTLAADGTLYKGLPVFGFDGVDDGLVGDPGVDVFAGASRPYMYIVGRVRAAIAGTKLALVQPVDLTQETAGVTCDGGGGTTLQAVVAGATDSPSIVVEAPETGPSLFGVGLATGGIRQMTRDSVLVSSAGTGVSTGSAGRLLGFGANPAFGGIQFANCTVAAVILLSSALSAGEFAALLAWSRTKFGTP